MTLVATPTLAPERARCIINPAKVAAKESQLLHVLSRSSGGLTTAEVTEATGEPRDAVVERLRRLASRGAIEKVAGGWRCAASEEAEEDDPAECPDELTAMLALEDNSKTWVRPINLFVRRDTSEFACRRYG